MATVLDDSFLTDLQDLSYNEAADVFRKDEGDHQCDMDVTEGYGDLDKTMQKVEAAATLQQGSADTTDQGMVEEDPEYQLVLDCNALLVDISNEIVIVHNFIIDKYQLKFPDLKSLVNHPIDYARVVKKIGNEVDLTKVDLGGLLPSAVIMVVSVAASTATGKQLPEDTLSKTIEACDRALALDLAKNQILDFVESRMEYIAPNLSAIVGSAVAAKLIGAAGGLSKLVNMPSCNLQSLGAKREILAGFSNANSRSRVGYFEQTEICQTTPPALRVQACRYLAGKSILAARSDNKRGDPTILKKIEKLQQLPPAKQPKPLPVPSFEPKKKRAGIRLRKQKNKYAPTHSRRLANRMQFGITEESSLGDGLGKGYGMLDQAGNGKLRVSVGQSKLVAKVAKKFKVNNYGSGGAASGLLSSLAFTPVQGIELSNPQACANQLDCGTRSTNFSNLGTFSKI
ncbi:hypothetical protein MKW98_006309 [Papaver atlanticum]|uniref:Nop domain-containing protein n=1 Tax=Papaver atlanticum TaxID=357466 RepID=A0AAD4TDT6_9MAGN|nr:hypothetical protein MKW98_006309 [Papaver atlanticum]